LKDNAAKNIMSRTSNKQARQMSLEAALEEERLDVLKLLEQPTDPPPKKSSGGIIPPVNCERRRLVSLILNDGKDDVVVGGKPANSDASKMPSVETRGRTSPKQGIRSLSNSEGGGSGGYFEDMDFTHAYRRLSHSNLSHAGGALGELYRSSSPATRMPLDEVADDDEDEEDEDNDELTDSDETDDSESDGDLDASLVQKESGSLMAAIEEERKVVSSSGFKVMSLLEEVDPRTGRKYRAPPPSMADYAAFKRKIIHPNTAFDAAIGGMEIPYTSDNEEARDAKRAAQLDMEISQIHSNVETRRMFRTMCRGNLCPLSGEDMDTQQSLRSFIVATDMSPAATHALEWTIGTVLRDGNLLIVVCAFEEDGALDAQQEEDARLAAMDKITSTTMKLLKKTRLEVHVVIEVLHCKSARHVLTDIIDHVSPTLVILGSRGRSALKGVLLGSFSNYIVERSSVPVMVARRKLQKTKNRGLNVRLANNLRSHGTLRTAKVD
jgi:nucleotide-binding universal stress UspA family protein